MALTGLTPTRWFRNVSEPTVTDPATTPMRGSGDPLSRLHHEMDRMFDSFFGDNGSWSFLRPAAGRNGMGALLTPQLDIAERKDTYSISVELPGVDPEDMELSADDESLTIRAEKQFQKTEGDDDTRYHRMERSHGRFERMLALPADADSENINAEFKNGVLEITIPRRADVASTRGRRIEIKSD